MVFIFALRLLCYYIARELVANFSLGILIVVRRFVNFIVDISVSVSVNLM